MFYAYEEDNIIYVCANLDIQEYKNYKEFLTKNKIEFEKTPMEDHLFDPIISKFKISLYKLSFENHILKNVFIEGNDVNVVNFDQALEMHNYMVDYENKQKFMKDDNKTIAEIAGIDSVDPWDKRTDKEKQDALDNQKNKKALGEHLTGQSFDPKLSARKEGFNINNVDVSDLSNIKINASKKGKAKVKETNNPFEE